jgi:ketosteroid isomerase-like protein
MNASAEVRRYGVPGSTARAWLQRYLTDRLVGRRRGTGLRRVSSPTQDAALVAEAQRNPFTSGRELEGRYQFSWSETYGYVDASLGTICCGEGCAHP